MSAAESDESYAGIVTVLNSGWRVIICRHRMQWILHRNRAETVARHVCRGPSSTSLPELPDEIFPRAEI
jgi:hypothetical protein